MQFQSASNARYITAEGSVELTVVATHAGNNVTFPFVVHPTDAASLAADVRAWLDTHTAEITPYTPPTLGQERASAKIAVVQFADGLAAPVINKYPLAERENWLAKEQEALSFSQLDEAAKTPGAAPLIRDVCANEFGPASNAARLAQMSTKVANILTKAAFFRQLSAYVEAFRSKYDTQLEAAADVEAVRTVLIAAQAEIAAAKAQFGI